MKNYKIRKVTLDDIDSIMNIEEVIYPNHHWSKESFISEISNKLATYKSVEDKDGNIAGFYGFWQILEEGHITNIGIHPDFRRLGLASFLMIDLIREAYKNYIKYITLEVRAGNIPAISLYDKFGFSTIGTRKKYYQDNNEDALIMFTENIWYDKFKQNFKKIEEDFCKKYGK